MTMNRQKEISRLLAKFLDQTISLEEFALFNQYLRQCGNDPQILRALSEALNEAQRSAAGEL